MTEIDVKIWQQANSIYALIADLPVADALARLDTIHDISEEVREVVITLINSGDQSSQYFREQVMSQFQMHKRQLEWKAGDVIADYELVEEVGRGGMSQVFKAKRTDSEVQKMVALKVFSPRENSHQLLSHFLGEQNILSGLSHKHIVTMHHGGTTDEDVSYIVMELIEEASSIDAYVEKSTLGRRKIVNMMRQAANAIAYAHNNLIIHRDIKPSNLMVDKDGHLKVVDFGIAKLLARDERNEKTTIMALTPSFAAPEQINNEKIGTYTDIFSLAAVTLSLLTGQAPFPKDRLLKSCSTDEPHLWQVLKTSGLDSDLKNILNKALQAEPSKRYQSMHDLARDLEHWLADEPVSATRDSWLYRLRKFARRRSAVFASGVTLLATATVGIAMLLWQYNQTRIEAEKAREVKEFMLGVFSTVDPNVRAGASISAMDLLAQAGEDLQKKTFTDSDVKAEMFEALGIANSQLGIWDKAKVYLDESSNLNPEKESSKFASAELLVKQEQFKESQKFLQAMQNYNAEIVQDPQWLLLNSISAFGLSEQEKALDHAQKAFAMYQDEMQLEGILKAGLHLSEVEFAQSQTDEAIQRLEQLLTIAESELSKTNTHVFNIRLSLQRMFNDTVEYDKAIAVADGLSKDVSSILGAEHPSLYLVLLEEASTYRAIGEIDEAQKIADEAYRLTMKHFGRMHAGTGRAINTQAVLLFSKGQIDEALLKSAEAIEILDQTLGKDNVETWVAKSNYASYLELTDQTKEAIKVLEELLEIQANSENQDNSEMLYTQAVLVRSYIYDDQAEKALALAKESLNLTIELYGNQHVATGDSLFALSKAYEANGQYPEALETMLKIGEYGLVKDDNERVISLYNNLGGLYQAVEDLEQARSHKIKSLERAIVILGKDAVRTIHQYIRTTDFLISIEAMEDARTYFADLEQALVENPINDERILTRVEAIREQLN